MDLFTALYGRIAAAASLTATLDTYAEAPAILSDPPPSDHDIGPQPTIYISVPIRHDRTQDFTSGQRDIGTAIRIYGKPVDAGGLSAVRAAVDNVAEQVFSLFDAVAWTSGGIKFDATAAGPVVAPVEDPNVIGRLVQLRVIVNA